MATDKELIIAVKEALEIGLTAREVDAGVKQSYQPTQQGVPTGPTIFIHLLQSKRFGWLTRTNKWDHDEEKIVHEERQWYESTFQVDALSIQDPADLTGPTAADLVSIAASIMQSDATRAFLRTKAIGIYRVTDERNPYYIDDKDRFEASPSFDFTLTHERIVKSTEPVVESLDFQIKRV